MSPKTRSSNKTAAAKAAEARTRERERAAAATLEVIRRAVQKYATGGAPKAAATSAPEAAPVAESEEPTAEGQFQALHSDDFFFLNSILMCYCLVLLRNNVVHNSGNLNLRQLSFVQ